MVQAYATDQNEWELHSFCSLRLDTIFLSCHAANPLAPKPACICVTCSMPQIETARLARLSHQSTMLKGYINWASLMTMLSHQSSMTMQYLKRTTESASKVFASQTVRKSTLTDCRGGQTLTVQKACNGRQSSGWLGDPLVMCCLW